MSLVPVGLVQRGRVVGGIMGEGRLGDRDTLTYQYRVEMIRISRLALLEVSNHYTIDCVSFRENQHPSESRTLKTCLDSSAIVAIMPLCCRPQTPPTHR